ncbi:hypothetical protein J22TS3_51450 [Paenibacillus sp. J22TS3]|nr:hypothetical protein J22TS3_51450 [Paenibacillus sp. J22TS3]
MELPRNRLDEEVWKGPPKKVKALYLKMCSLRDGSRVVRGT